MHELSSTAHGRLLSVALTIALVGGGFATAFHGIAGIAVMCIAIVVGVALALLALAMSIEARPAFTVVATIVLPPALFVYVVGIGVAVHNGFTWAGALFIALGSVFGLNLLHGLTEQPHVRPHTHAHAH